MSDKALQQAIRAFTHIWSPISVSMSEAEACDAHFDGGEWSGPAWDDIYLKEEYRVMEMVCKRFGVSPSDVHNQMMANAYDHYPY